MLKVHHLNCGTLHKPPNPVAACHCLLLEEPNGLALVDTGIGLLDVQNPIGRVGANAIEAAGYQFDAKATAIRQIEARGFKSNDIKHIFLTHGDPDHVGGLADFPNAVVHISAKEHEAIQHSDRPYSRAQFDHKPIWRTYSSSNPSLNEQWFGISAHRVDHNRVDHNRVDHNRVDHNFAAEVWLVELFGHTVGHCGVAVRVENRWILHVGDAYFLRAELFDEEHPVGKLAVQVASNNAQRLESLSHIRRLINNHAHEVDVLGYHDFTEFP
jgi:glyoxylase-like metal-dependent hydrolase (beta-lactamase superfamily II)